MTTILSETRERLLKVILAHVPPSQIAEIHFFAPIKQGGVESGVAVIAAVPETPVVETLAEQTVDEPADVAADSVADETVNDGANAAEEASLEAAPEAEDETAIESAAEAEPDEAEPEAESEAAPDAPPKRHVIYTARYRYTLKGPDRGKWETNVKAEADAPLVTVETVVRGVQRRVGDADEPDRMTGDEVRTITDAWAAAALPGNAPAPR